MMKKIAKYVAIAVIGLALAVVISFAALILPRHESPPAGEIPLDVDNLTLPDQLETSLNETLLAYREEHHLPSISVSLGLNDELVYSAAVGYADLESGRPATTSSLYRIGSVSKSITAVALGRQVERGELALDDTLQSHLPDFPKRQWDYTLRQLASHTAGIRHYSESFFEAMGENYHTPHYEKVSDGLVMVRDSPLVFEPGTAYRYSSYGYNILSAAMVEAADTSFTELLQQEVFDPAEMTVAQAEDALEPPEDRVSFYMQAGSWSIEEFYTDNSYKIAGGGIISNTSDLVRFGNALLAGRLVGEEMMQELFTPLGIPHVNGQSISYGLGFRQYEHSAGDLQLVSVAHSGGSVGGITYFLMYPEHELVAAVTINVSSGMNDASPGQLAHRMADLLLSSGR